MSGPVRRYVSVMRPDGSHALWERTLTGDEPPATEDEMAVKLYGTALAQLAKEDRRYISNYNMWQRWDGPMRAWWIGQIEAQAAAGKDTIGVHVVTRVAIIRLSEGA